MIPGIRFFKGLSGPPDSYVNSRNILINYALEYGDYLIVLCHKSNFDGLKPERSVLLYNKGLDYQGVDEFFPFAEAPKVENKTEEVRNTSQKHHHATLKEMFGQKVKCMTIDFMEEKNETP